VLGFLVKAGRIALQFIRHEMLDAGVKASVIEKNLVAKALGIEKAV
jgi:hypothetical protein